MTADDLEALFAAPSAGETDPNAPDSIYTESPATGPMVKLRLAIEGSSYGGDFVLPPGFPTKYTNERAVVEQAAIQLGEQIRVAFIEHYFGKDGSE